MPILALDLPNDTDPDDRKTRDDLYARLRALLGATMDADPFVPHDSWVGSVTVTPGDMTRYDLAVAYDPTRHPGAGQWLIALTNGGGGSYWITMESDDDAPHSGYLADKVRGAWPITWGLRLAMAVAGELIRLRLDGQDPALSATAG